MLYVRILKVLYRMIESALLWYTVFTEVLQKEGFKLNPYDPYVANPIIKDKQCTVGWYNILSHVEPKVGDEVLATIETDFPGLPIKQGSKLNFLGMEIDFFEKGKLKLRTV